MKDKYKKAIKAVSFATYFTLLGVVINENIPRPEKFYVGKYTVEKTAYGFDAYVRHNSIRTDLLIQKDGEFEKKISEEYEGRTIKTINNFVKTQKDSNLVKKVLKFKED